MKLWLASFAEITERLDHPEQLLDPPERRRAAGFAFAADASAFIAGRAFLRCVLAAALARNSDPFRDPRGAERLELQAGKYGKPQLPGVTISFNASRTKAHAVVVTGVHECLGVDMESLDRTADMTKQMRKSILSQAELLAWNADPSQERRALIAWTRKEAIVKADGRGLRLPVSQIVTFDTGEKPDALPQELGDRHDWFLRSLSLEGNIISTALRLDPAALAPDGGSPSRNGEESSLDVSLVVW